MRSCPTVRTRQKKILKLAKGYRGRSKNCLRLAKNRVEKGLQHAYRDRRRKKRDMRRLWIQQVNAAARAGGMKYGTLMYGLRLAGVSIDRKSLSKIAQTPDFSAILDAAKSATPQRASA